jgi:hypothetical protein
MAASTVADVQAQLAQCVQFGGSLVARIRHCASAQPSAAHVLSELLFVVDGVVDMCTLVQQRSQLPSFAPPELSSLCSLLADFDALLADMDAAK